MSRASRLSEQAALHNLAYSLVSRALELDVQGNLPQALLLYTQAQRELTAALALNFTPHEHAQAMLLADKMARNLDMVNARILFLTPTDKRKRPSSTTTTTTTTTVDRIKLNPNTINSSSQFIKNIDSKLANSLLNNVLTDTQNIHWDDIAGLTTAKQSLKEIIILPSIRPELFTGLRTPARGVLLYGPPGTGKTMLAKTVAHEAKSTFFCISASSLTSKFVGESEKLVHTLFALAKELSPSIIFIDEIDSILTERSESENEASRRLKTQFLLEFDGVTSHPELRLLIMGATNRPQDLDEAARRRFVQRIYVPLPDSETRRSLFLNLLLNHRNTLTPREISLLVNFTDGYSASDITALAREASLGPIRDLGDKIISVTNESAIRSITFKDFRNALLKIKASVSKENLKVLDKWSQLYGSLGA